MASKRKDDHWYLSFLPYNIAGGATSPLIPLFITQGLSGTVAQVGIVSAISSMASVPANILWGNLSDTTKKRKVFVLIGFIGLALALLTMGLSMSIGMYFVGNLILGAIAAAVAPVGTVLVLETSEKKDWAKRLGDFSKVGGVGWVTGLIVGTVWLAATASDGMAVMGMRALFLISAALCIVSIIMAARLVPEPEKKIDRSEVSFGAPAHMITFERGRYGPTKVLHILKVSAKNMKPVNFPKNLKLYYLVTFLTFTGFLTFYVGLPIFLNQAIGLSVSEVFIVYVASSLISALTYSLAGRWTQHFGGKRVQSAAYLGRIILFPSFFLITLVPMPLIAVLALLCVLHALIGFCWANLSVAGSTLVSNMSYCDFRTQSLGLYNSIQGVAAIVGSLIGGFVAQYFGYLPAFLVASSFVFVGLIMLLALNVDKVPCDEDGPKAAHA
jgi:MFS family permease